MTSLGSRNLAGAVTKTRLDIGLWPELEKITYDFVVLGSGEADAGPFMFGWAFDAPPIFAYSTFSLNFGIVGDLTRYEIELNFEGLHLQGYGNIFDIPARVFPDTVMLHDNAQDVPILTIGVAEWLLDERGMYVGANLWVVAPEFGKGFG